MPRPGRLSVAGPEDSISGGTILMGLPVVFRRSLAVLGDVAVAGLGEQFVQPGCPVVRAGRVNAHRRHPLESLERPQARCPG
jgi:hypothetical protein